MGYNFKNLEDWKKTLPNDYRYAKYKNMLPFICEKMGWCLPENYLLAVFNGINDKGLKEAYAIFLDVEKEMNTIKIKNNKTSEVRLRKNLRILKQKLKTIKKDISLLNL